MDTTPTGDTPARSNRRSSRRQPPKSSTRVRAYRNPLGLGRNIAVAVLDLAETGARLVLSEELTSGSDFQVTLESATSRPAKLIAQVVWSLPTDDGRFLVGVRFHKALSYVELNALSRT